MRHEGILGLLSESHDGIYPLMSNMIETMLAMAKASESWHLPEKLWQPQNLWFLNGE